jgi:hypothetical protein
MFDTEAIIKVLGDLFQKINSPKILEEDELR